jgi:Putative Ig domain
MLAFTTTALPSGNLNTDYSTSFLASGGIAPYTFSFISGTLPPGLSLSSDFATLSGTPTELGIYNFTMGVTDSSTPLQTAYQQYTFLVMDLISLSSLTVDQSQFVSQLQSLLSVSSTWSTGLTTQTSQTLIELISAIGTYVTSRIVRVKEDAFPSTAQSDSSIRAIANMQGLRLARKLPATVTATLSSTTSQQIPPYTQFSAGGYNWFNDAQITLLPNVQTSVILKEGIVYSFPISGLGTNLQAWVSTDDQFTVSDQDVQVVVNAAIIEKAFGGLWNYSGTDAYADMTLPDGRLLIQFGANGYGCVPGVNDQVTITYAKTQGDAVNGASLAGTSLTSATFTSVTGSIMTNPSGGAAEKSPLAYKNFSAGTFGTFGSAVTKPQYQVTVSNYPGIVDAITQSQREINTQDVRWMNVIRVSALTNSPWQSAQIKEYLAYLQSQSMYSPRFLWQDPVPIPRTVSLTVYCFNSVSDLNSVKVLVQSAITNLFAPRTGILLTNFYEDDLITTARNAAPGQISYVTVESPTTPMVVTLPSPPTITYSISSTGGTLGVGTYSYAVSINTTNSSGGTDIGTPSNWVFPNITSSQGSTNSILLSWPQVSGATSYVLWGRLGGQTQQLATLSPTSNPMAWTDTGTPANPLTAQAFPSPDLQIRYNTLASLTVNVAYASRQSSLTLPVRDVLG